MLLVAEVIAKFKVRLLIHQPVLADHKNQRNIPFKVLRKTSSHRFDPAVPRAEHSGVTIGISVLFTTSQFSRNKSALALYMSAKPWQ
jgi:hypothetical protein